MVVKIGFGSSGDVGDELGVGVGRTMTDGRLLVGGVLDGPGVVAGRLMMMGVGRLVDGVLDGLGVVVGLVTMGPEGITIGTGRLKGTVGVGLGVGL